MRRPDRPVLPAAFQALVSMVRAGGLPSPQAFRRIHLLKAPLIAVTSGSPGWQATKPLLISPGRDRSPSRRRPSRRRPNPQAGLRQGASASTAKPPMSSRICQRITSATPQSSQPEMLYPAAVDPMAFRQILVSPDHDVPVLPPCRYLLRVRVPPCRYRLLRALLLSPLNPDDMRQAGITAASAPPPARHRSR